MIYDDIISQIVSGLTASADRHNGRRIVILPTTQGWRLGYALPNYGEQPTPMDQPKGWVLLDYLSLDRQGRIPLIFDIPFNALAAAMAVYSGVMKSKGTNPVLLSIWDEKGQLYPIPVKEVR